LEKLLDRRRTEQPIAATNLYHKRKIRYDTIHSLTTGISGLDEIHTICKWATRSFWQVDDIADYRRFVDPYVRRPAPAAARRLHAVCHHAPLLQAKRRAKSTP
jgi:hypothetical protein